MNDNLKIGVNDWLSRKANGQLKFSAAAKEDVEELRDLLTKELRSLYQIDLETCDKEVDRFLSTGRASQSNLDRLERHVQARAAGAGSKAGSVSGYSAGTGSVRSQMSRTNYGAAYTPRLKPVREEKYEVGTPRSSMSMAGRSMAGEQSNWSHIARYAKQLDDSDKYRQKLGDKEMKNRMRAELDQQMQQKKAKQEDDKRLEQEHFFREQEELKKWNELQAEHSSKQKEKAARLKFERGQQMQADMQRKADEKAAKIQEDKEMQEKISIELQKEKEKAEQEKMSKKQEMAKTLEESQAERKHRSAQKRQEAKLEVELCRKHNAERDAQIAAEKEEKQKKDDDQKLELKKAKEQIEEAKKKKGEDNDAIAAKQKTEADARHMEVINHRTHTLKVARQQNQAFLFRQMDEKKEKIRQEKEVKDMWALVSQKEYQAHLQRENELSDERKQRYEYNNRELKQQMIERQGRNAIHPDVMSAHEMALNKQILGNASDLHKNSQ